MHPDVFAMEVPVLYHDAFLVAVDKPAGMVVHRAPGARDPVVVMTFVRDLVGEHVWPVHRIDRQTSGIVLVAITLPSAQRMYEAFRKNLVRKEYLAVVHGQSLDRGRVETPLEKDPGVFQAAVTEYETLAQAHGCSLLRVRPHQGRRHQIRRHLRDAGLPLVGDPIYGDGDRDAAITAASGLERLALHASRLCLPHPGTRAPLEIEAPLPPDLARPLRALDLLPRHEGMKLQAAGGNASGLVLTPDQA